MCKEKPEKDLEVEDSEEWDWQIPIKAPSLYHNNPISMDGLILDYLDILAKYIDRTVGISDIDKRDINKIKKMLEKYRQENREIWF